MDLSFHNDNEVLHREQTLDEVLDLIAYTVLCAPNSFPKRDYVSPSEQLDLKRAFVRIRDGLKLFGKELSKNGKLAETTLEESLSCYEKGETKVGSRKLQEVLHLLQELKKKTT